MNKSSAAQKAQSDDFIKNHLHIVKPGATVASEKVSKLQEKAEDVQAEPIDQERPAEATAIAPEEVKPTEQQTPSIAPQTIEDIKRKAELLTRLSKKYDDLISKLHRVEDFVISHDQETASVKVKDAMNFTFESNSPKTIGKLIEFWKDEFSEAIKETEKQMREIA